MYFWLFISLHALQVYREGVALQLFNSELWLPLWYLKAVLCIQGQQLLAGLGSLLQENRACLGCPPILALQSMYKLIALQILAR